MSRYPTKLSREKVEQELQRRIEKESFDGFVAEQLLGILPKYEDKPISKRIATALQKKLGDGYYVFYETNYNMFQVVVWKQNNRDLQVSLLIGYKNSEEFVNTERIKLHIGCYILDKKRIAGYKEAFSLLDDFIRTNNRLIDERESLNDEMELYNIRYLFYR